MKKLLSFVLAFSMMITVFNGVAVSAINFDDEVAFTGKYEPAKVAFSDGKITVTQDYYTGTLDNAIKDTNTVEITGGVDFVAFVEHIELGEPYGAPDDYNAYVAMNPGLMTDKYGRIYMYDYMVEPVDESERQQQDDLNDFAELVSEILSTPSKDRAKLDGDDINDFVKAWGEAYKTSFSKDDTAVRYDALTQFRSNKRAIKNTVDANGDLLPGIYDAGDVADYNAAALFKDVLNATGNEATSYLVYLNAEYERVVTEISYADSDSGYDRYEKEYTIRVNETDQSHSFTEVSQNRAYYGEIIELDVTIDEDYALDYIRISWYDEYGSRETYLYEYDMLEDLSNRDEFRGIWEFVMPEGNVNISIYTQEDWRDQTFSIDFNESELRNGELLASKYRVKYGDTIVITAIPDSGYKVGGLRVNNQIITPYKFNADGSVEYEYTIDQNRVDVKVNFVRKIAFTGGYRPTKVTFSSGKITVSQDYLDEDGNIQNLTTEITGGVDFVAFVEHIELGDPYGTPEDFSAYVALNPGLMEDSYGRIYMYDYLKDPVGESERALREAMDDFADVVSEILSTPSIDRSKLDGDDINDFVKAWGEAYKTSFSKDDTAVRYDAVTQLRSSKRAIKNIVDEYGNLLPGIYDEDDVADYNAAALFKDVKNATGNEVTSYLVYLNAELDRILSEISSSHSGACGDNVNWILDKDGVLTISGTGEMDSYFAGDCYYAPWYEYKESIQTIIIKNGVTTIGDSAFFECEKVTSVEIADTVIKIEDMAFLDCDALIDVYYDGYKYQWEKIENLNFNSNLTNANLHFLKDSLSVDFVPEKESLYAGKTFIMTFTQPETVVASTLNLSVNFDNTAFEIVEFVDVPLALAKPNVESCNQSGKISIYWTDPTSDANTEIAKHTNLLEVKFKVKDDVTHGVKSIKVTDYKMTGAFNDETFDFDVITPEYGYHTVNIGVFEKPTFKISGSYKAYGDVTEDTTAQLLSGGEVISSKVLEFNSGNYTFDKLSDGEYTLRISKKGHCTREYNVTVADADAQLDVEIRLYGDVNGDGDSNNVDVIQINRKINNMSSIFNQQTDADYRLKLANVTAITGTDTVINNVDAMQINRKINNMASVFDRLA